jgi:porphobilinogen synthase
MERFRRLRKNTAIRSLIQETHLRVEDFVYPLFVVEGTGIKHEIPSLPDVYHFSVDELLKEVAELLELGIDKILLFGLPEHKDEIGSGAYAHDGIVQQAIRAVKSAYPEVYVITDVCLCQYTDHGHCGCLSEDGHVLNDETLELLAQTAVSHAEAGADMVAPSDMMDGRIGAMREAMDAAGYTYVPIMSYAAKYCSNYYGPFREAAHSAPQFGDRKTYQMDYHNRKEASRTVQADLRSGADIVMVKPALSFLDIIRQIKDEVDVPVAAYNVSGEYSMLKMAVKNGLMNEMVIYETLVSMKRAGADIIITYFAKEMAIKYREGQWS